jgi:hypothetical protein
MARIPQILAATMAVMLAGCSHEKTEVLVVGTIHGFTAKYRAQDFNNILETFHADLHSYMQTEEYKIR